MWQDFVFTVGSFLFIIGLIPTVRGSQKPPLSTSFVTGLVLLVFAVMYLTLELYLSAVVTTITSMMWATLFLQRHRQITKNLWINVSR